MTAVCRARAFEDAEVCYGCLHRFDGDGRDSAVAEETAFYTRCDQNRHMNNTYYADIVCDHVPLERIAAHAPARLAVVYHSEVPMGASFTLLRAQTGENGWYFVGTDGEKKHFEANLTLTE